MSQLSASVTAVPQRIGAIDTLRGFALLGILLMNIMIFAMPSIAYYNPTAYSGDAWHDRLTYWTVHVLADQKFMALFSLLFGASVMLITSKMESTGTSPLRYHYVRNFWLLLIGMAHGLFIWYGDILTIYALTAFGLYPLRHIPARWQLGLGLAIFLLPTLGYTGAGGVVPATGAASIAQLTADWQPPETAIQKEIDRYLGPYQPAFVDGPMAPDPDETVGAAQGLYYLVLLFDFFARTLGMMLVGMALFKLGVLTANCSDTLYRRMLVIGLGVGVPLSVGGLVLHERNGWDVLYSPFVGQIPNQLATPFIAAGYIGLSMLWSRTNVLDWLQDGLSNVGKMALSNYIAQSLIATFIFYGYGLGLFGSVGRAAQLLVVVAIWGLQIAVSSWWMMRFRYGPLEWLWRSLSLFKPQPLRREYAPSGGPVA